MAASEPPTIRYGAQFVKNPFRLAPVLRTGAKLNRVWWALTCALVTVAAVWRAKARWPKMTWAEFVIIRGSWFYARMWHRWSANRADPLPANGPVILVCTHTSSADPTFLLAVSRRRLSFLVAHEFYDTHPVITFILDTIRCVRVRRGGHDPMALRQALARLRDGGMVALFPEGNLSGVGKGRMSRAKPGAALLALASRAPVIPVCILGGPRTDQLLFSWLVPTRRQARVLFGDPIDLSIWHDQPRTRPTIEAVRDVILDRVVALMRE
jgi:1-acyl-sn-glycerol-3-phosphate acyltransferase